MTKPTILIVDDDAGCRRAVCRCIEFGGMNTIATDSLTAAAAALEEHCPACILTEFRLPDGSGVDFLSKAGASHEHVGRVMLTGVVDFAAVQEAVNRGAVHAFFTKPWDNDALVQGVRAVFEQCRLSRENVEMMRRLEDHNRRLEETVRVRTGQLEHAKSELEAVFDSWTEPVALVDESFSVLRANRAWADRAGISVREVPGRTCHEALFQSGSRCAGCPLAEGGAFGRPSQGHIEGDGIAFDVSARPIDLDRPGRVALCRYECRH